MSKLGESILSVVAVGETRFRISKMISRIGHRPQKAFWGITLSLEALGKAPGSGTPSQIGLWAGVAILEINLLPNQSCHVDFKHFLYHHVNDDRPQPHN